jgi:hypothetical protein
MSHKISPKFWSSNFAPKITHKDLVTEIILYRRERLRDHPRTDLTDGGRMP